MYEFNDIIKKYYPKFQKLIEDTIISINLDNDTIKGSLGFLFTENYFIYPKFLFFHDSNIICRALYGK